MKAVNASHDFRRCAAMSGLSWRGRFIQSLIAFFLVADCRPCERGNLFSELEEQSVFWTGFTRRPRHAAMVMTLCCPCWPSSVHSLIIFCNPHQIIEALDNITHLREWPQRQIEILLGQRNLVHSDGVGGANGPRSSLVGQLL